MSVSVAVGGINDFPKRILLRVNRSTEPTLTGRCIIVSKVLLTIGANRYRINQAATVPSVNSVIPDPTPPQISIRLNRRRGCKIGSEL